MEDVQFEINEQDLASLRAAVLRNPRMVLNETGKFLTRGMAAYNRIIIRRPWRVGGQGGGAPVDTGNLRDTHIRSIGTWEAFIRPDYLGGGRAPYAPYIHGLKGFPRKRSYQLRPWLDYAVEQARSEIDRLQVELLDKLVSDLAK